MLNRILLICFAVLLTMESAWADQDPLRLLKNDLDNGKIVKLQVFRSSGPKIGLTTPERLRIQSGMTCVVPLNEALTASLREALERSVATSSRTVADVEWGIDFIDVQGQSWHSIFLGVEWNTNHLVDGTYDAFHVTYDNVLLRWLEQQLPTWTCVTRKF